MKKKYKVMLFLIGTLLFLSLAVSTSYGVWLATNNKNEMSSTTLNCFKIYYSNGDTIENTNIKPILNEDGKETSPHTLTVTNICNDTKELQLRLNITKQNTVDLEGLMLIASGNIEQDTIKYEQLNNAKTTDDSIVKSKLIGLVKVNPNETVRTNIKLWFDEKTTPNIDAKEKFSAKFELIDTESSIKPTFSETILANNKIESNKQNPNFTNISTTDEGLYKTNDNEGETYYFRGNVNDNFVTFAGYTWRIVRINGDKSVRLILDKAINNNVYSQYDNAIDYTGLKYIYNNESINNDVNNNLLAWYNSNILNKNLDKYVATTSYCNDSNYTVEYYHTYFNTYNRLVTNKNPQLNCQSTTSDFGGIYKQKIGLITADEVVLAGGNSNIANYNYYLYNGENFYTMSPAEYFNYHAYMFSISNNGSLITSSTNNNIGVRPVINIESTTTVSGSGTKDNPYKIDLE